MLSGTQDDELDNSKGDIDARMRAAMSNQPTHRVQKSDRNTGNMNQNQNQNQNQNTKTHDLDAGGGNVEDFADRIAQRARGQDNLPEPKTSDILASMKNTQHEEGHAADDKMEEAWFNNNIGGGSDWM